MSLNQYAVYQIKQGDAYRRFRYKTYEQLTEDHLTVDVKNYQQVYFSKMFKEMSVDDIRAQLKNKLPLNFKGSALNVSDVIAVTKEGISTAYYVDKIGLEVIPGFFRFHSSAALITMDTKDFTIKDRPGNWVATDETVVDGKQFFLMASQKYGNEASFAVVDDQGRKAAEDTAHGFDDDTIRQIRLFLQSLKNETVILPGEAPKLETYQKYYENGEYLRSAESYGEQNFDMIDGRVNNRQKEVRQNPKPEVFQETAISTETVEKPVIKTPVKNEKRRSVLQRLKEKQKEVAARYGKNIPEQENAERNRK